MFDAVKHTSNYTPDWSTIPETIYHNCTIWSDIPETMYVNVGNGNVLVTFSNDCDSQSSVISEVNRALTAASLNDYLEAYALNSNKIGIRLSYGGEHIETFTISAGSPDALITLGWDTGTYPQNMMVFVFQDTDTLITDGLANGDTLCVYSVPFDIKEMVMIYAYLGLLIADPTYQHNFTNPYEEPNPQYQQFQFLAIRYEQMKEKRVNNIKLLN